ncbi:MAG: ABC transporter permease [Chloroflexi bacterium]|nr:ABC transporter permease [Chloroflexota bacterium]
MLNALHDFAGLFGYRDLIRNFVARDLKVRYKNSALGIVWSMLNPLGMMVVFTVVFTILIPNNAIDRFPLFVMCGILPWNWFSGSVMASTYSVLNGASLVKKVYFPREVLPISVVLSNLVHFLLALVVLLGLMLYFGTPPTWWLLYLPLVILIQFVFILGLAFLLSAVNVYYRDTAMVMDVLMLAWFFLTPVVYSTDFIPVTKEMFGYDVPVQRLAYILNPMASLVASYRVIIYNGASPDMAFLARTIVTALGCLLIGYGIFRRLSRNFGEVL